MNARQLEIFRAVMLGGSMTNAAERLRISQPAVSKAIQGLEREAGLKLFVRARKRLVPTAEAELLFMETGRYFFGLAEIAGLAQRMRTLKSGKLTIGSLPALGLRVLPAVIAQFLADKPEALIDLQIRTSPVVADWTITQQVDVGITLTPVDHPAVKVELLDRLSAVCILPIGHPLVAKQALTVEDLRSETFVSLGREDRARFIIDGAFERADVERRMQIDTNLSESACCFVAEGAGVSIVDALTAAVFEPGRIAVRPIQPRITFDVYLLSPSSRPRSLLAEAFLQALREGLATILQGS